MECKCRNIVEIEINNILEKFEKPEERSILIGLRRRLLDKLEEHKTSNKKDA